MAKIFLLILAGLLVATVVCRPHWLSENTFLMQFINYEVLGLMAVILTVTLASVTHINLSIKQIVETPRFKDNEKLKNAANGVKREIKENAWYIFWGFVLTIIVLLIKGLNGDNEMVVAISNGLVIWFLFLFIACMHDIYRVSFGIDNLET